MRVFYNSRLAKCLLPKHFYGITLFSTIFFKEGKEKVTNKQFLHEFIHYKQQEALGFFTFVFLYLVQWFINLLKKQSLKEAYYNISFEIEAYNLASRYERRR